MLKPHFLVSIYLIIATTLHAAEIEDLPFKLKEKIAQAAETCRELDNGEFYLDWGEWSVLTSMETDILTGS